MKVFLIVAFCFVASSCAEILKSPLNVDEEFIVPVININDYLDKFMQKIGFWIVRNGLDPLDVEDIKKGFSVKLGLIDIHGDLALTHGWLQGLSTIERSGDATMDYEARILTLHLPLSFKTVLINYDYEAKIMNLGPTGGIEGKIKNLKIIVDIAVDLKNVELNLQGFKIDKAGSITVDFSGNPLVDWLSDVLTNTVTLIFHDVVVGVLQNKVRVVLEKAIEDINTSLQNNNQTMYLH